LILPLANIFYDIGLCSGELNNNIWFGSTITFSGYTYWN